MPKLHIKKMALKGSGTKKSSSKKPYWKNPKDYEHMLDMPLKRWAWEALRRHPEYKEDYKKFKSNPDLEQRLAKKYHLKRMRDPSEIYKHGVNFIPVYPLHIEDLDQFNVHINVYEEECVDPNGRPSISPMLISSDQELLLFDIHGDIKKQIKTAEKILEERQKNFKSLNPKKEAKFHINKEKWVKHIRVLDALEENALPKKADFAKFFGDPEVLKKRKEQNDSSRAEYDLGREITDAALEFTKKYKEILIKDIRG